VLLLLLLLLLLVLLLSFLGPCSPHDDAGEDCDGKEGCRLQ